MNFRTALAALIAATTATRLLAAASLGLGNDEAYHFLYAVHPAASYFDHPPMIAWVERLGLFLTGPFSILGQRLGFVALAAGSTWLMARIARRWHGDSAGLFAALALNLSGYYGLAAGTFALPDGPLLFFWLLTVDRIDLALQRPERLGNWLALGLAWGLAMCCKYHAVFLPAGVVLYLLARPGRRRLLVSPGPWLAVAAGLLVFSPVLVWNAHNGWASFVFQGRRARVGLIPRPDLLLTAVAAQAAYLFPWIWLPLMVVGGRLAGRWRDLDERDRLALCLSAPPLAMFTAVACFRPVLPHWGLVGVIPLFPALGRALADRARVDPVRTRRRVAFASAFPLVLLAATVAEYRGGWLQRGPDGKGFGVLTPQTDPTAEAYGWDQVARRLDRLGVLDDPRTFLFTNTWYQSAHLAHATRLRRPVVCYNLDDARGFAFWSDPDDWVGRDGVLVVVNDARVPFCFHERWFRGFEALDDFEVTRAGKPIRRVRIYRMNDQVVAFPFRYAPEDDELRERLHRELRGLAHVESPPPAVGARRGVVRR